MLSGLQIDSWIHDVVPNPDEPEHFDELVVAPDDSVFATGFYQVGASDPGQSFVAKYRPDGTLDSSFGKQGVAWLSFQPRTWVHDIAVQVDGRVIIAGEFGEVPQNVGFLRRLRADGTLDTSFGENGILSRPFRHAYNFSLHALPDGDIITVVGYPPWKARTGIRVSRFDSQGLPRTDFGDGGYLNLGLPDFQLLRDSTTAPDGSIVLTGFVYDGTSPLVPQRVFVARVSPEGRLDSTFGGTGIVFNDQYRWSDTIAVDSLGRVLLVGEFDTLIRYTAAGVLDLSFGNDGQVLISRRDFEPLLVRAVHENRIVVGGFFEDSSGAPIGTELIGLTNNGEFDPTFGDGGVIRPAGVPRAQRMASGADSVVIFNEIAEPGGGVSYQYTRVSGSILTQPMFHLPWIFADATSRDHNAAELLDELLNERA